MATVALQFGFRHGIGGREIGRQRRRVRRADQRLRPRRIGKHLRQLFLIPIGGSFRLPERRGEEEKQHEEIHNAASVSKSILPPDTITPTRFGPGGSFLKNTVAAATAPLGSTRILRRSNINFTVSRISSSETRIICST